MYAGFYVSFETDNTVQTERFVIPALVKDTIADLIDKEDIGNDEYIIRVRFGRSDNRPQYAL
jgi:hypothetical protein